MRFATTASVLRDALTAARHATPSGPAALVAYTGVHLLVKDATLAATGSDGTTTITASAEVNDTKNGSVVLLPRPILSYLSSLEPASPVVVESVADTHVTVTAAGAPPYEFRTLSATFPSTSSGKSEPVQADLSRLGAALASARSSAGKDGLGVQLVSTDKGLVLHTTDNYRLTRVEIPEAGFGDFVGTLPLAVLETLARYEITSVAVDPRGKTLEFNGPTISVSSRLLAAPFPPVEGLLTQRPPHTATAPAVELRRALVRLASVADDSPVTCKLEGSEMTLTVRNADTGAGVEVLALTEPAPVPAEFVLKVNYLADAAASQPSDAEGIQLSWSAPLAPVVVSSTASMPVVCMVQPLRV